MRFEMRWTQLPTKTPEEFIQGYNVYVQEREAHKKTVGEPAPWPEHEIFRLMYEREVNEVVVIDDRAKPAPKLVFPPGVDDPRT